MLTILDLYARVYEELLAVPVIKGRKSEKVRILRYCTSGCCTCVYTVVPYLRKHVCPSEKAPHGDRNVILILLLFYFAASCAERRKSSLVVCTRPLSRHLSPPTDARFRFVQ